MVLYIACGALAVVVLGIVLLPLFLRRPPAEDAGQFDRAVYRDQLLELEQDVARGLVGPEAAAAARLEIERRILAASGRAPAAARIAGSGGWLMPVLVVALLVVAPVGIYLEMGAPGVPDMPFASRPVTAAAPAQPDGHSDVAKSLAALEERLRKEPDNAERWMLYARTTASLNLWDKSLEGYRQVMRLVPDEPDVLAGYGEMQVMAAEGIVTPGARDAFAKAVAKDPVNDVARFYLALADAQAGESRKAIDAWLKLAADAPEDSEMREEIARRVEESAKLAGIATPPLPPGKPAAEKPAETRPAGAAAGGPDPASIAAADEMPAEQRDAMVRGMVAQLADKLNKDPSDAEGWLRLGRAYLVLKEPAKATDAYDRAAKLRPGDVGVKMQEAIAVVDTLGDTDPVPPRTVQLLKDVLAADPKRPEVYWYLGIAAARGGDRPGALERWKVLLTLLPADGEDRKMVQGAIDSLK